jgi:hypothetical protein
MGRNPLTQQVAAKALDKLEAVDETQRGDAHPTYGIYHNGVLIASTGLRHSPKPDILVPHVKRDLRVNVQFILDLARCPKNKIDWLRAVGAIPSQDAGGQSEQDEQGPSASEQ